MNGWTVNQVTGPNAHKKRRLSKYEPRPPDPWDHGSCDDDAAHADDHDEATPLSGTDAANELLDLLMGLQLQGRISAKTLCIISYWSARAGAAEPMATFAKPPGLPSGNYQRFLDAKLGYRTGTREKFIMVNVPQYRRHHAGRTTVPTPMLLPHIPLQEEIAARPGFADELQTAIDAGDLPKSYTEHDVVKSSATPVAPIGLYLDGVPFLKKDSVLGFWLYNVLTQRRHLIAVLRKRTLCKCGCRGWCSVFSILDCIRWSLTVLAGSTYPETGPYGDPWKPYSKSDELSGNPLEMRMALIAIKGDWSEFANTLGFFQWNSVQSPCFLCLAEKTSLYELPNSVHSPLAPRLTLQDYRDACNRCQIVVTIDRFEHTIIRAALRYDKTKTGARGRALTSDIPALGLLAGDRLEQTSQHPDIGAFEMIHDFPATVCFWRRSLETITRHDNPLFHVPGVGPELLMIDVLHVLYLGIAQPFIVRLFWKLLTNNAWQVQALSADERNQLGVLRLRAELMHWYKTHRAEGFTEVQDLSLSMLGTNSKPANQPFKGAETKGMLFLLTSSRRPWGRLGTFTVVQFSHGCWSSVPAGTALEGVASATDGCTMRTPVRLRHDVYP